MPGVGNVAAFAVPSPPSQAARIAADEATAKVRAKVTEDRFIYKLRMRSVTSKKPKEPELNRAALLMAASEEFAERGFQGARLEEIARRSSITRAMIYYYFGGREGLYTAALEEAYSHIRNEESALDISGMPPIDAVCLITRFRIDYYVQNPLMVSLIAIENQQKALFLKQSKAIESRAGSSLKLLTGILQQGQDSGIFRKDVDVVDVHRIMVSIGMFNISNQYTFGAVFSRDLSSPEELEKTRQLACDVVLGFLAQPATVGG